ncbi:hypothetical protein AALP_AA7G259600 [Arabis alpina]|uniref:Uncharacterized protein n=1 Tax=Arabis alpina TaxID=50452 RepID=A0A087GKM5_ARAAL|nr:hypothetical protein AALP_AA7G259600 [Arabis alpina]
MNIIKRGGVGVGAVPTLQNSRFDDHLYKIEGRSEVEEAVWRR